MWWRNDDWPTPDEWSATWAAISALAGLLAGIAALIAVIIAKRQLGQLIWSNRMLKAANDSAAAASADLIRPYVYVELYVVKREKNSAYGNLLADLRLRVRNAGRTVARDVSLTVDPPFEPSKSAEGVGREGAERITERLDSLFDGSTKFPVIFPDASHSYLVDNALEHIKDSSLPRRHTVEVKYMSQDGKTAFADAYVLDTSVLEESYIDTDGIREISAAIRGLDSFKRR